MIFDIDDMYELEEEYKFKLEEKNKEIKRLQNIIKEVREYVKWDYDRNEEVIDYCNFNDFYKHILEILDKEK